MGIFLSYLRISFQYPTQYEIRYLRNGNKHQSLKCLGLCKTQTLMQRIAIK